MFQSLKMTAVYSQSRLDYYENYRAQRPDLVRTQWLRVTVPPRRAGRGFICAPYSSAAARTFYPSKRYLHNISPGVVSDTCQYLCRKLKLSWRHESHIVSRDPF